MKLPALILIACTSLYAQTALASKWYKLEMIVVAYTNMADIDKEHWPAMLENQPTYPLKQRISWIYPYNSQATNRSVIRRFGVPSKNHSTASLISKIRKHSLAEYAKKINENKDMQVIYHRSWLEPIQSQKKASAHKLRIASKEQLGIEINGEFKLYRHRFLHIDTDFHIQHYAKKALEKQPEQTLNQENTSMEKTPSLAQTQTPTTTNTPYSTLKQQEQPEILVPIRAAQIKLTRRMRSNELHYLDHPMLGMIIKAIPVD